MFENACYKFFGEEKSWNEAKITCEQNSGQLTSIHSTDELAFIRCLQDPSSVHTTWIGAQRTQNGFEWIDGSLFDFDNWHTSEPDNNGGNENCIEVHSNPSREWHDKWNDSSCDQKKNFVCKKNPVGGTKLSIFDLSICVTNVENN